MYDIIIIGAGPSGSSFARLLDKRFKVLILEKRNLDEDSNYKCKKPCGGLLAPVAQKEMIMQDLKMPKEVLSDPQVFSVKTIEADFNIIGYYQKKYVNFNREKFDRYLFSLIPDTVDKRLNAVFIGYKKIKEYYEVYYKYNNQVITEKTKYIVSAEGANSKIRRDIYPLSIYTSLQKIYRIDDFIPAHVSIFKKDVTDYYSWIIRKDDLLYVGTAIDENKNIRKSFSNLIEYVEREFSLTSPLYTESTAILIPRKLSDIKLSYENIFFIGESAALINPSSAEGISYALKSARFLAEGFNRDNLQLYKKYVRKLKKTIFLKLIRKKIMFTKLTRILLMRIGIFKVEK